MHLVVLLANNRFATRAIKHETGLDAASITQNQLPSVRGALGIAQGGLKKFRPGFQCRVAKVAFKGRPVKHHTGPFQMDDRIAFTQLIMSPCGKGGVGMTVPVRGQKARQAKIFQDRIGRRG